MDRTRYWHAQYTEGRKQPIWYQWARYPGPTDKVILGHYETPCGGCDTIGSAAQVYQVITQELLLSGFKTILCEGLLLSEDTKWSKQLPDLRVLFLNTPVETCLERIRARRLAAGNEKPLKEDNTRNRVGVIERAREKLLEAGVRCHRCSDQQAVRIALEWLKE